jgi:UDP-glucose:glycoprotein glucosyltransferase
VSGYGVELALKRTDYIVIDDREAQHDAPEQLLSADDVLDKGEDVSDLQPLSTSELTTLGLKAASFIMQNSDPLATLIKLTQDFPRFSASIAAHEVSTDLSEEHDRNRALLARDGSNYLWINGAQLTERQIEPFTLIDTIRRERKLINNVRDLGFNGKQAVSLLGHPSISSSKAGSGEGLRFDWTDRVEDGKAILWLNDLENDELYADYPRSLTAVRTIRSACVES